MQLASRNKFLEINFLGIAFTADRLPIPIRWKIVAGEYPDFKFLPSVLGDHELWRTEKCVDVLLQVVKRVAAAGFPVPIDAEQKKINVPFVVFNNLLQELPV